MSALPVISSSGVAREDPDELIARARGEHQPVAVWCLFSGGNDSTVLAHRCREHYQGLAFIDTGTAVPGVAEFVREYAEWIGKPLRVLQPADAFRVMVLGDLVWWARFIAAHDREPGLSIEAFIARDTRRYGRASGGELGQRTSWVPRAGRARPRVQQAEGTPAHAAARARARKGTLEARGCCSCRASEGPSRAADQSARRSIGCPASRRCSPRR